MAKKKGNKKTQNQIKAKLQAQKKYYLIFFLFFYFYFLLFYFFIFLFYLFIIKK